MENFIKLLTELKEREFTISDTTKGEQIQQTQRNQLKAELLQAINKDIQSAYDYVYPSKDGLLIEIANDSIANGLSKDNCGSGAITTVLDIKVLDLSHDAKIESESYLVEVRAKAEKKKAEAEAKAKKIAKDKADRFAKMQTKTAKEG